MGSVSAILVVSAVFAPAGALAILGWISWLRTRPLRHGHLHAAPRTGFGERHQPVPRAGSRTAALTLLPGLSGLVLVAAGLFEALILPQGRGPPLGPIAVAVAGGAVAASGLTARVTTIHVDARGLTIRYRCRAPFVLGWVPGLRLEPPRWPLGGWTVRHSGGRPEARRLMPSDLWGMESVLDLVATYARLRFDGRAWVRPSDLSD